MPMISGPGTQPTGQFASMGIEGPKSGSFSRRDPLPGKEDQSPQSSAAKFGVICYVAFDANMSSLPSITLSPY